MTGVADGSVSGADSGPVDGMAADGDHADRDGDEAREDGASGGDADSECSGEMCGGSCCPADKSCVDEQCLEACSGTRCGDRMRKCCTGEQVCLGAECVTPGEECERTEECAVGEICEPTVGRCVSRDHVEVCEYRPPEGEFSPTVDCNWSPNDGDPYPGRDKLESTPMVANVTDDNGDGKTDTDDIPELIFLSHPQWCCNQPSTIRIVSGECNDDGSMTTLGSILEPVSESSGGLAVGDLNDDGVPEIVAITRVDGHEKGAAAWRRTEPDGSEWEVYWENPNYPSRQHTNGGATASIADLEADGDPEVVIGNIALDGQTGDLKWDGLETTSGEGGVGNNAFLGPSSAVADVDLDGDREVAAGNTLYDYDGSEEWTYEYTSNNSPCGGNLPCDGFTGIADFDEDPEGEIVIVRLGEVFILDHDGTLQWKHQILKDDNTQNESGPPTIADFDGDGAPEIGTAAADYYTVLDPECDADPVPEKCRQNGILWATPNDDDTSRATASSVFDFEGDGAAEMVYADEQTFYILDGETGEVLHRDDDHRHNTRIEMPIVADVDNDTDSEVVVGAPRGPNTGVSVWADQDDNWVRTRRIWNQHAYSVTNVEEDGSIPTQPKPNWRNGRLNNFRQNMQPAGVFDAPDLVVSSLEASDANCVGERSVEIDVELGNDGALGVQPGVVVRLTAHRNGMSRTVQEWRSSQRILPGQHELLETEWAIPEGWLEGGFELRVQVDPDDEVNECETDNNAATLDSEEAIALESPDLEITSLSADASTCSNDGKVAVDFTVENTGSEPIAQRVPVVVRADHDGDSHEVGTFRTAANLAAGATESFSADWTVESDFAGAEFDVEAVVDPDQTVFACSNLNRASTTADCEIGQ